MSLNKLKLIVPLFFLGIQLSALTGDEVVGNIENEFSRKILVFSAEIEQTTFSDISDPVVMKGRLTLKKPDKFSVDYKEPEEQIVKCNGKRVWIYVPSMKQVVTQDVKDSKNRENILFGFAKFFSTLRRNFKNTLKNVSEQEELVTIESVPRAVNPEFRKMVFLVDRNTWLPAKITVNYSDTSLIIIKFSNIRINGAAEDRLFEFTPPEGTAVVDSLN